MSAVYPPLPEVESGSDSEDRSASRWKGKGLEVQSRRNYESENGSSEHSDKDIDELSRLLGGMGQSSKDSGENPRDNRPIKPDKYGQKSKRKSAEKPDERSIKEFENYGKNSNRKPKDPDKRSSKKPDKPDKVPGKKSGKDSSNGNGKESGKNDETPTKHTKATRYTEEEREEITRIRKCAKLDYYRILNLNKRCPQSEVKPAFKRLIFLTHPDKVKYKDGAKAFQR